MSSNQERRIDRAIRTIRQRIYTLPEGKQASASVTITKLKAKLPQREPQQYHWMYAAE